MEQTQVMRVPGWLAWLLAIPVLAVAAVFGFFVLLAVPGLVLAVALYFGVRIWWLRRKMRRAPGHEVLEGEYTKMGPESAAPTPFLNRRPPD